MISTAIPTKPTPLADITPAQAQAVVRRIVRREAAVKVAAFGSFI